MDWARHYCRRYAGPVAAAHAPTYSQRVTTQFLQLIASELQARNSEKARKPHWNSVPSFWLPLTSVAALRSEGASSGVDDRYNRLGVP